MMQRINEKPDMQSVIAAMQDAWRDHQHARDQTWKTLNGVVFLTAGLVTVQYQFRDHWATSFAALLALVAGCFGLLITKHHREYERRKFTHIMRCEHLLGLRTVDENDERLLSTDANAVLHWKDHAEKVPTPIEWIDIVKPGEQNTALFIMRMHAGFIIFTLIFCGFSLSQ